MAFAETANLAVKLTLGGNFTSQLAKSRAALRGFDKDASRAYKAGTQIGTGIKRGTVLAVAGISALTGLLALSVKEGQEAAKVEAVYANAIAKSGKVSADYVRILDDQQQALMNLGGVDDELIKTEQTRLIQMGLTGKQVAELTPLVLDFAKATGVDLLTATKLAGKAAQGNTGALSRYGVMVDKAKAKVDPFAATVDALNSKFGGTTRVLGGSLETRLAAFREGLANVREEAGMKLLPVLTRIVDMAGKELVPAFGKFVDRIMPSVLSGLDQFADLLSNGGAERGIRAITDALGPMVELVKIAAAPVKAIVSAFLALPKELQTVVIGAFAVNKLTGGLVTNVAGGLAEALGRAVLGGIKAPLVNVTGGVVNVGGGIPGGGKGGLPNVLPGAGAAAGIGGGTAGALVIAPIVAGAILGELSRQAFANLPGRQAQLDLREQSRAAGNRQGFGSSVSNTAVLPVLRTIATNTALVTDKDSQANARQQAASEKVRTAVETMRGRIADELSGTTTKIGTEGAASRSTAMVGAALSAGAARSAGASIVSAIYATRPMVSVNVDVSATSVTHKNTTINRYGPSGGSRYVNGGNIREGGG